MIKKHLIITVGLTLLCSQINHASTHNQVTPIKKESSIVKNIALAKEANTPDFKKSTKSLLDQLIKDEMKVSNTSSDEKRVLEALAPKSSNVTPSNPLNKFFQKLFGI